MFLKFAIGVLSFITTEPIVRFRDKIAILSALKEHPVETIYKIHDRVSQESPTVKLEATFESFDLLVCSRLLSRTYHVPGASILFTAAKVNFEISEPD
jgi:Fe2+ or Zn2+ uptake regulation protein